MDDNIPNRRSKWDSYDVEEELRTIDKKNVEVRAPAVSYMFHTQSISSSPPYSAHGFGLLSSIHIVVFTFLRGAVLHVYSILFCN